MELEKTGLRWNGMIKKEQLIKNENLDYHLFVRLKEGTLQDNSECDRVLQEISNNLPKPTLVIDNKQLFEQFWMDGESIPVSEGVFSFVKICYFKYKSEFKLIFDVLQFEKKFDKEMKNEESTLAKKWLEENPENKIKMLFDRESAEIELYNILTQQGRTFTKMFNKKNTIDQLDFKRAVLQMVSRELSRKK